MGPSHPRIKKHTANSQTQVAVVSAVVEVAVAVAVVVAEEAQSWPPFSWELSHKSSETEESFFFFSERKF